MGLTKAELVFLVKKQPEVRWPSKVCSYQEPNKIAVKHLKKALLGPYGYVKDTPSPALQVDSEAVCSIPKSIFIHRLKF